MGDRVVRCPDAAGSIAARRTLVSMQTKRRRSNGETKFEMKTSRVTAMGGQPDVTGQLIRSSGMVADRPRLGRGRQGHPHTPPLRLLSAW